MAIQKKSLLKTLKTAKKAKVASAPITKTEAGSNQKAPVKLMARATGKALARATGRSFVRFVRFARLD